MAITKIEPIPSIIHKHVFNSKALTPGAKVFYGMVYFLYRRNKICNAGTSYLAYQMQVTTRSIQYYIQELKHYGYLTISYKNKTRYLIPDVLEIKEDGSDIACYIPKEVLRYYRKKKQKDGSFIVSKYSNGFKLRYGYMSYKSANSNGYYEVPSITALADELDVSRSTIYRDFKRAKEKSSFDKTEYTIQIKTFNSYQDWFKKDKRTKVNSYKYNNNNPPDDFKTNLTPSQFDFLQKLVGRN